MPPETCFETRQHVQSRACHKMKKVQHEFGKRWVLVPFYIYKKKYFYNFSCSKTAFSKPLGPLEVKKLVIKILFLLFKMIAQNTPTQHMKHKLKSTWSNFDIFSTFLDLLTLFQFLFNQPDGWLSLGNLSLAMSKINCKILS